MRDHRFWFVHGPVKEATSTSHFATEAEVDTPVAIQITLPGNSDGAVSGPAKGGEMQVVEDQILVRQGCALGRSPNLVPNERPRSWRRASPSPERR